MPGCRSCGGGTTPAQRRAAHDAGQPIEVAPTPGGMWEVLTPSGSPSGRKFNSRPRARAFAASIGGTIRPLTPDGLDGPAEAKP